MSTESSEIPTSALESRDLTIDLTRRSDPADLQLVRVRPALSIVVPARNERARLDGTANALRRFLDSMPEAELVLAIDTGSDDGTPEIGRRLAEDDPRIRIAAVHACGKGHAILAGIEAAEGDVVLMADTDLAVGPEQFSRLIAPARRGAIAIASRSIAGSKRHAEPFARFLLGRAFNVAVRSLILPGIRDTQCGFKAFPREIALDLLRRVTALGWTFDVELLALARREGIPVVEVPVDWTYGPGGTMRPIHEAKIVARDLWRVRRRVGRVKAPHQ